MGQNDGRMLKEGRSEGSLPRSSQHTVRRGNVVNGLEEVECERRGLCIIISRPVSSGVLGVF